MNDHADVTPDHPVSQTEDGCTPDRPNNVTPVQINNVLDI